MNIMPQPFLFSVIDKAVYDYKMIEDGDRILVGASGGKDSTVMINYLANRMKRRDEHFTFTAMHVQTEITPPLNEGLSSLLKEWNVTPETLDVNVLGRLKPGLDSLPSASPVFQTPPWFQYLTL